MGMGTYWKGTLWFLKSQSVPFQYVPNRQALAFVRMALLVPALFLAGCAPVLLAFGAVGGYAISKDSVTMDLDRPMEHIWNACVEETRHQGAVKRLDPKNGRLDAQIQQASVVVTVEQLTPATVRVVIRARRNLLPRIEVAQRLAIGIARRIG